uniref:SWIM-type domain-containing protein n=1 Tax=Lactuca sativa TaxID=4236 RepID=A0A9R1UHI3_LACSA|nr:hypothetical protein LSAT_V11C900491060 [Lactuca sativa]
MQEGVMASSYEGYADPFAGMHEPFAGLSEMDFELHDIYIDHELEEEFVSSLDKCKNIFLNVLLSDENVRNSSMADEIRAQVYLATDWQSDEDEHEVLKNNNRIHDPTIKWDKMVLKLGDIFESPAQLKFCVTNYAVSHGYRIYFEKCDSKRIVVRCGNRKEENKCPFRIYAAWMYKERSFQIKAMNGDHKCSRQFKFGSIVSPEWIGRHYVTKIENKPKMKLQEMIDDMRQRYRCVVSIGQVRRARKWAKNLIEGKFIEHYARIWDYAHELLRSNPGSTCQVGVTTNPDGKNYFHRFYICFKALSDSWKRGCRRVIGLDGCFLKGQVYPIAWAVVDVENKCNWTWFLELLSGDLDLIDGRGLVVISDQHKVNILPHVEHRQCARHIYANFRKSYTGVELKKLFWAVAMSCVEGDFKRHMDTIKKLNPGAYEHLLSKEPQTWCRAYMSTGYVCEAVKNGISECFKSIIVDTRKKPLITMLDEIRIYIMDRFAHMIKEITKWNSRICPVVFWLVIHSQQHVFEARRGCDSYMVDLDGRHCTCRLWDLAGIPCVHAFATINYIQQTPDEYIDHMFSKEQFLKCYSANITTVNGSNLWPQTEFIKPLPLVLRRMRGRPKVNRRRHVTENDGRVHTPRTVRCGKCFEYGHNQKGYKNAIREPVPMPPKKKGRPRREQCEPSRTSCDRSERQEPVPMPPKKKGRPRKELFKPNQASFDRSERQEAVLMLPKKKGRPRKKVQFDPNQASGSKFVRSKKKLGIKRGGGIVEDRVLLDEHDGLDGHVEGRGCEEQMKDLFDKEDIDYDSLVDMMCTFEASLSQAKYNYQKGDGFQDAMDAIIQSIHHANDEKGVEDVEPDLTKIVDEVEDAMDAILKGTDEKSQYENEGNPEPEFTEGNASDVLPEMVMLDLESVADLLGAEYNMAEIESMRGFQDELDDMPPVEMDVNEVEDIPYVDGVMEGNEGEVDADDADEVAGEGEGVGEGDGDGVGEDDGKGDGDIEDEGDGAGEDDATDLEGNDADDEGHVPPRRTRKPSERIILQKLKKPCFDKDGRGSTSSYPPQNFHPGLSGVREIDTPQTSPQSHLITFLFLILVPPLKLDLEDEVVIFPL